MASLSVSELSDILKACFENPAFRSLSVYGEVYSIKIGKYTYIEIGDQGKKQTDSPILRCAFSSFYQRSVSFEEIKVGDVISITGSLSYYAHGSSLTFWGRDVEILKSQEGKNLLKKKKILEKLDKLGYLDEKRKRKLPRYCKKVAILTAEDSAAYQDILKTLHDRFPLDTVLFPCTVQGDGAAKSIVSALLKAQKGDFDCILLGRGGGSKTDLSCFDDELLALTIAESKIPVITCIGHTIDTAIADRVSDLKAITPTEGASLINPSLSETIERRETFYGKLTERMRHILENENYTLDIYLERLESLSMDARLKKKKTETEDYGKNLDSLFKKHVTSSQNRLNLVLKDYDASFMNILHKKEVYLTYLSSSLDGYDPEKISRKGYALVYKDGRKVTSSRELCPDDKVLITYPDGRKEALIKGE